MRIQIASAVVTAALAAFTSAVGASLPTPGLYEVEVRIVLPNVQDVAAPLVLTRCVSAADVESGRAFFVLSENPLRQCDLLDYQIIGGKATYRIVCAGPNRGSAVGVFDASATAYRGSIKMNMGGKNMTMSETQIGRRIGDCR